MIGLGALATLPGGAVAQELANDAGVQAVSVIKGDTPTPPSPKSIVSPNKLGDVWAYYYIGSDHSIHYRDHTQSDWGQLKTVLRSYGTTALPTSPTLGTLVLDKDRGTPAWWDADRWEFPNFVDNVLTSPATVANTTTRTAVFDPGIQAMSLVKGRVYQLELYGTFETANTSDQFTVDVDLAGTDVAGEQNAQANAAPGTPWTLELTFTVRDYGTNGVLKADSRATFNEQPRTADHGEFSVDTTVQNELTVYITWSAADPQNSVTIEQAHLKQMG